MVHHDPFDVISSTVDLDDPAQHNNAQRLMANALARVVESLPANARSAVLTAKQSLDGRASPDEILAARVELWKTIQGRDQSDDPEVLRIRTTICALHCMAIEAPCDSLGYFLMSWERSGLSMVELAGAIRDVYGIS